MGFNGCEDGGSKEVRLFLVKSRFKMQVRYPRSVREFVGRKFASVELFKETLLQARCVRV
jgi:hypothetical protein